MTRKRDEIFRAIEYERYYQDRKWGPLEQQNGCDAVAWLNTIHEEWSRSRSWPWSRSRSWPWSR